MRASYRPAVLGTSTATSLVFEVHPGIPSGDNSPIPNRAPGVGSGKRSARRSQSVESLLPAAKDFLVHHSSRRSEPPRLPVAAVAKGRTVLGTEVAGDHFRAATATNDSTVSQHHHRRTQAFDGSEIVTHKEDGLPGVATSPILPKHCAEMRRPPRLIPHQRGEYPVLSGGHGEGEAHIHAAGIAFDRSVNEALDLGKCDNRIELTYYLFTPCRGSCR